MKLRSPQHISAPLVVVLVVGAVLFGLKVTLFSQAASGWLSGASSGYAADGSFGTWRGEEVTVAGTWVSDNAGQVELWTIQPGAEYGAWNKPLDIAIGAIQDDQGESWAAAASGAYDARWRQSAQNMKAVWTNRGKPEANLMIRFAHEMNGNWYPWKVRAGEEANFRAAWIRWSNIVKAEMPQAKRIFNVNKDSSGGMARAQDLWPGKQYADVYSVDWYNNYPFCDTTACLDSEWTKVNADGSPVGPEKHRQLAESFGVPFAISEWSNSALNQEGGGGESPVFMTYMNTWMRAHAGTGAGQLYYEILFNLWTRYAVYGPENNQPVTADRYRQLTWGDGGVTATPTPTATPVPTATPTPTSTVVPTPTPTPGALPSYVRSPDVNRDGTVNVFDLSLLLNQWTQ